MQEQLETAQTLHRQATQLQTTYQNRLADWQQEKATLQNEWHEAMERWKSEERLRFEKQLRQEKEQIFSMKCKKPPPSLKTMPRKRFYWLGNLLNNC
ncbi:hypothetical protein PGH45_18170 [Legionella pneumophila]|nr:hypothetical protein [Legionella pneumophila]